MAVPKRKVSKARRDKRRANVCKMTVAGFVACKKCGELKLPYRICPKCGSYDGKQILEVEDPKAKAKA